ncbi:DUF697 domain-containing protein [Myxacorys almedinensis]|uniref:DUF697 domain-containing protein n=1 Tax=Myxacorys almedinensis A TaxID=2690445 RepID=A0A8J7Z8Q4_9CYAN|nr:DUF697 domain-containing protein [Myxacorys almedinensis]NDJ18463.1 DUF697 domain-containing protein [Myxacorys almedinensis A]
MAVQWRRPLIYSGMGLTLLALGFDGLNQTLGDWLPAIVIGSGIAWAVLKFQPLEPMSPKAAPLSLTTVKAALTDTEGAIDQLAFEVKDLSHDGSAQQLSNLRSQVNHATKELQRDELRLVVMGGKSVGKTTLAQWLSGSWESPVSQKLVINDTPELFAATEDGMIAERDAWQLARSSDLVLFVTNGDLTATELHAIERITTAQKRLILLLNKRDQYRPEEQQIVLTQLRQRVQGMLPPRDVIAIATNPKEVRVRQVLADGMTQEWLEKPNPQMLPLVERLNQILMQEGQQLILSSSLSNLKEVKFEANCALNRVRRDRAMPMVDQAQWIVAGTAFANPFPALDLLATAAINAQMVMDLSKLYQRQFSLEHAKTIATTIASLMLKLGLVEISTQAIASILKTNAVTFVAGGVIQGISGAYLTRLAGLTLIEYFEGEASSDIKRAKLQRILQTIFEQNRRLPFMQLFVKQALDKLRPGSLPSQTLTIAPPDGLPAPTEALLHLEATLESGQPLMIPEKILEDQLLEESVLEQRSIANQEAML